MENLILPKEVIIQLKDDQGDLLKISGVIFTVHLFARHKNDFYLGPFVSDKSGKVTIRREDLDNEIKATYSSGMMDYTSVETCHPSIEIFPMEPDDIERVLNAREKFYVILLDGEKERWGTLKNLLNVYRQAKNHEINISKDISLIRDKWDGEKNSYSYDLSVNKI